MKPDEFAKEQYISLREEVKETKDRIFKILLYGVIVIPAADFLAQTNDVETIIVLMPLLILVIALLYMSETNAKMRCGRFIRLKIEKSVKGVPGWEAWLEKPGDNYPTRVCDKYLDYGFYLLFALYFVSSVTLAYRSLEAMGGLVLAAIVAAVYSAIGVIFSAYLFRNMKTSTS